MNIRFPIGLRFRSLAPVAAVVAIALAVILLAAWWRQRADLSRIREDYASLQQQAERLEEKLREAGGDSGPQAAGARTANASSARLARDRRPDAPVTEDTRPAARPQKLTMAGTEAVPIPGGLAATLRFRPNATGALGLVALAVRLQKDSPARILDLAPAGPAVYADDSRTVSEDGRFAFYQGTVEEAAEVAFTLTVSGPAAADVRGTSGIGNFRLDIRPSGAEVLKGR